MDIEKLNALQAGAEIKATIRFWNAESNEKDQVHLLTVSDDGYYFTGTVDELSYNYNVIDFEIIKG